MRNRTPLVVLTAIISFLCLYYLSFTFIGRGVESDAVQFATEKDGKVNPFKKQAYLDSMWTEEVFLGYTYKQVKENEVKLGLDLQGGMNVTMEVSAPDILALLSNNNQSPAFAKSLKDAKADADKNRRQYVDAFADAWKANGNGLTLASIFSNKNNKDRVKFNSPDADVLKYLNDEVNSTINRSFEILRTRIDKFGVTQPNIQRLAGTNRIQIELPGVDNPERVRKLLQGVAKLEFFEVFEPGEINNGLQGLNNLLLKEEAAAKAGGKNVDESVFGEKLPSDSSILKAKTDGLSTDSATAKADSSASASKADTTKKDSADLASKLASDTSKNDSTNSKYSATLSKLLIPISNTEFGVNVRDTARLNRLFARNAVKNLFPNTFSYAFSVKPLELTDGREILTLFFIKRGRNGQAPLEGDVIVDARPDFGQTGEPEVSMQMNSNGARIWKKLTAANIKRRIAIILDNKVYSAPTVQNEIPNGNSSISGSFTIEEAKDLANILKAGKMPVPTRIVEEAVVGPTLGAASINQGLISIIVGFLTIILFMAAYYSKSGIVADIAVLLNVFLILGILVPVGAVLTLPGIAGIVLTIGMAVDANVLINERVKDELEGGQPLDAAITNGYSSASVSIWDANLTTAIAGVALLFFGTGTVQGFATTLLIGIATSLFTSIYITRIITEWQMKRGVKVTFFTNASKNLFRHVNFDFVSKRKLAYLVSAVVIGAGLISLFAQGLNYGADFSGGWTYLVKFNKSMSTEEVRNALKPSLGSFPEVKTYGSSEVLKVTTTYLITDEAEDAAEKVQAKVEEGLKKFSADQPEILSSSKVGPTIAEDIKNKSILAVVIAMFGIFAYIWIRFRKWEYALGATIAVIHDTLVIITVYSVFKDLLPFSLEIDQNFIAAILTIVGFSVNDTVVIFDRIREGFRENTNNVDAKTLINRALNYTFSRTVVTSSTVFLVVLILLIFGGETIRGLSFALLIGVITGTYSTIYIAVPFLVDAGKDAQSLNPNAGNPVTPVLPEPTGKPVLTK